MESALLSTIQHLQMLKAEIEWDHALNYQIDLDVAIQALEHELESYNKGYNDATNKIVNILRNIDSWVAEFVDGLMRK